MRYYEVPLNIDVIIITYPCPWLRAYIDSISSRGYTIYGAYVYVKCVGTLLNTVGRINFEDEKFRG